MQVVMRVIAVEFIGNRLAKLRSEKGISARDMSLSLGQSQSYINNTQYYIINYEDQDAYKCVLINDNGEVISEPHAFSVEFDPENPGFTWYTQYSFATMHGICVQTDDGKVWWYNRNA